MKRSLLLLSLAACATAPATPTAKAPAGPPPTRTEAVTESHFGIEVADPYRWLEDASKPEVQQWMTAQNAYARSVLDPLPGRSQFEARTKELLYAGKVGLPMKRGGRLFYEKRPAGKEKSLLYWRADGGEEHVLLDPAALSPDGSIALGRWEPSWDGKKLAYLLKPNNADAAIIHVLDVDSGAVSNVDVIPGGRYADPSWTPDSRGFYYVNLPDAPGVAEADLPGLQEVRFHALGADPKSDPMAYPARHDPELGIGAQMTRDGHWLFITVSRGWSEDSIFVRDLRSKSAPLVTLFEGKNALASVDEAGDRFYVLTNEGAPRYRMYAVDPAHLQRPSWKEIVPQRKDAVIEEFALVGDQLALTVQGDFAAERLELRGLDGKAVSTVPLPGLGVLKVHYDEPSVSGNPGDDTAFFTFSSPVQPPQVWRLQLSTGKTALWDAVKLPLDPSTLEVETAWYPSKDGTKISMYLVHKKGQARSKDTPYVLYGYGGFNISESPGFDARILPWVEAGGGWAVAQLRGGAEYGEAWHQAGMLHHKQNVFDDFAAAAEFLAREGYTSPAHLAIRGGSNGGLLVSTAMTQHPELYGAVVCAVPLTDMVRFTRFGEGKTWAPEYGSPENEADFKVLYGYSPYHHVKPGVPYPALLMLSADHDDRVDPMHARKFVAAVQARSTSGKPVLLRIQKNAGHGGADLVNQTAAEWADSDAFCAAQLGLAVQK